MFRPEWVCSLHMLLQEFDHMVKRMQDYIHLPSEHQSLELKLVWEANIL